jgi:hypothetical protein
MKIRLLQLAHQYRPCRIPFCHRDIDSPGWITRKIYRQHNMVSEVHSIDHQDDQRKLT